MNLGTAVGDEPEAVRENRARLQALVPGELAWLRQVHGTTVVQVESMRPLPEADACIARSAGHVCVIQIADCLPVLFCDRDGSVVAAAHAGWRGLSSGVLEATIAAMQVPANRVLAYLGPAIGPTAFEVGMDVVQAFTARDPEALRCFAPKAAANSGEPKWLADLFALARLRLERIGLAEVHGGGECTVSNPQKYFSHRRDRRTGRQAALIWLQP